MERLRYYIAHNSGLELMTGSGSSLRTVAELFPGRTIEHLEGSRRRPEVVFAAVAFDGGYRTTDAGATWQKVLDGDVRTFTIDPHDENVVYAGSGPIRLHRSSDGGATWEHVDAMLDFPESVTAKWGPPAVFRGKFEAHVRSIFVHPDDRNLIFVLLEHGGVLLSRDGGATWSDRSAGIDYVDMHVIHNVPGSSETYCVSSAQGFYRTADCGAHWVRSEQGMPWAEKPLYCYSHEWRIVPGGRPRMVLCGGRGSPGVWVTEKANPHGHILLSDDDGVHWRLAQGIGPDEPSMPWVLAAHPTEPRTLFCGTGDGGRGFGLLPNERGRGAWYVSRDAGESWDPILAETPAVTTAWVAAET